MKNLKPIDLNIYVGSVFYPVTDWTDDQLEDYVSRLRNALTANGNWARVDLEESNIVVITDVGGDNKTFLSLIYEAYAHGCRVEIESADEFGCVNMSKLTGAQWAELEKTLGVA